MKPFLSILLVLTLTGCSILEDEATNIAYDIERGIVRLGRTEGASHVIVHDARSRAGPEVRTIKVQFDKVGALIVWYMDANGTVVDSGSTSYLSRFVDISETIIRDKPIDSPFNIEVQRRNGRAIVANVY